MGRDSRHKRARCEDDAGVLGRLARLCGSTSDPSGLLEAFRPYRGNSSSSSGPEENLSGSGLEALCAALNCAPRELMMVAKQVPRSLATEESIPVGDLCFLVARHVAPTTAMERRKASSGDGPIPLDSPLLKYYEKTLPWTSDGDWEGFVKCLSVPLPMALRIHNSETFLNQLARGQLAQLCDVKASQQSEGQVPEILRQVSLLGSAYPAYTCSHNAFHSNPNMQFACRSLHSGSAVSFQEIVSMLPVLLLQIQPNHNVLDMCAAPGSKTVQALDELLRNGWDSASSVLLANEKDTTKACQILPARLKRYHAPDIVITRCDATKLPRLQNAKTLETVRFDRVICDVPCSGDGTIRKERSVLSSWSEQHVAALASTQRALLKRAIDMLEVGGLVTYSTCSMNPLEDEEVINNAMRAFGSSCELLDAREILRTLGIVGFQADDGVMPSMEPPADGFDKSKVLRVLPHRHDTGGFFVAVLRKTHERSDTQSRPPNMKLNEWMGHKRWALVDCAKDEAWKNICSFYGISEAAAEPFSPVYHVNPNGGPQRRICLITEGVRKMIFETKPYKGPGLEVVTIGVRAFEHYDKKYLEDAECRWRVAAECASYLASIATKRKLVLDAVKDRVCVEGLLLRNSVLVSDASSVWGGAPPMAKGSVLLGISGGPAEKGWSDVWWLSATLNGPRLELAVDSSLKALGLFVLYDIKVEGDGDNATTAQSEVVAQRTVTDPKEGDADDINTAAAHTQSTEVPE